MSPDMQAMFNAITRIRDAKRVDPSADKARLQHIYCEQFAPQRNRSVFVGDGYALRFSEARTGSFSNTVLSLSALKQYDHRPFVVVVAHNNSVDFLLANSTFLKKISHSSLQLRTDNIKGSFNGTDIITNYEGLPNTPDNFETLFALHTAFTWDENIERLVEATNAIVGRNTRFAPTAAQLQILLEAPERAAAMLASAPFKAIETELNQLVRAQKEPILAAARIDNVNLRGNAIEQLLTGSANAHELGDLVRPVDGGRLVIDIKTKLLDRAAAPKAYNVDKMLAFLSEPGSVLAFLMIGVDVNAGAVNARLLPVLERSLLRATGVQHHWAGRASRGVTQLSGRFRDAAMPDYVPTVDLGTARAFLQELVAL